MAKETNHRRHMWKQQQGLPSKGSKEEATERKGVDGANKIGGGSGGGGNGEGNGRMGLGSGRVGEEY